MTEKENPPDCTSPCFTSNLASDSSSFEPTCCYTLERIIDLTDEMAHLNELVLLHLEKCGGFTTHESYFSLVQPVLDQLEVEIGIRYQPGMTTTDLKLVVQDWIDCEIAKHHKFR